MSQLSIVNREAAYASILKEQYGLKAQDAYVNQNNNEMSMEEYQEAIQKQIREMSLNKNKMSCNQSVKISDEAYEAMKEDPAYEKWVLSTIESEFARPDPKGYQLYNQLQFGASQEEFQGNTIVISSEYEKERIKEERRERMEEKKEEIEKRFEKQETLRQLRRDMYDSLAEESSLQHRTLMKKFVNGGQKVNDGDVKMAGKKANACADAILAYEMNCIMEEILPKN